MDRQTRLFGDLIEALRYELNERTNAERKGEECACCGGRGFPDEDVLAYSEHCCLPSRQLLAEADQEWDKIMKRETQMAQALKGENFGEGRLR